ncbi:MAG: hypothetical protein IVW56_08850 [Candidatus Binataceae bacterium]|nr:hypothetical protein [Candidatus Binataceae bacterium]
MQEIDRGVAIATGESRFGIHHQGIILVRTRNGINQCGLTIRRRSDRRDPRETYCQPGEREKQQNYADRLHASPVEQLRCRRLNIERCAILCASGAAHAQITGRCTE